MVAYGLVRGRLVAVWETYPMITEAVRDYCIKKWGMPVKRQWFHNDVGMTVDVFKWTPEATGEGVTTYVTVGASARPMNGWDSKHRAEFFVGLKPEQDGVMQRLAMLAAYPAMTGKAVDHGHTVTLDDPLWPGSEMRTFLILRQLDDVLPALLLSGGLHIEFLQVVPIHDSELQFKNVHGVTALFQRWRDVELAFWDPWRDPVPAPGAQS